MANADVIAKGLEQLHEAVLEFSTLMDVLNEVGGNGCPLWVDLVRSHQQRIHWACEKHADDVQERALPLLRDFECAQGDMGASAPMVTSGGVPDRPGTKANANGLGKPTAQARPDSSTRK